MIFQDMALFRKAMFWKILANFQSKFSPEGNVTKERYFEVIFNSDI